MNEAAEGGDEDGSTPGQAELPELDPHGTLAELLGAPDRDRCPGARPVVSVSEEDDPRFIAEVESVCVAAPRLERRGVFHGDWAELHDELAFYPPAPLPLLKQRWEAARPIVLHDALPEDVMEIVRTDRRLGALSAPGGLAGWARERAAHLAPDFEVLGDAAGAGREPPREPAREVARVDVGVREEGELRAPGDGLWIKAQRLSDHPADRSLRVRFSFGREVDDDASRDLRRHRQVARVAEAFMPELAALHRDRELRELMGEWIGARPLLTQAIAYWNAPQGGARFHHDAFDEPMEGRQRGVLYAQLTGSTAWLALSLADLAARVEEFAEYLEGGAPALLRELLAQPEALRAELALPGLGRLGPLLESGPEFTSLLADAGHGFVLSPGDVIFLPNHGLTSTCMHSVFCAGDEPGFSLSLAIREAAAPADRPRRQNRGTRRGRGPRGGRRGNRGHGGRRRGGPGSSRRRR